MTHVASAFRRKIPSAFRRKIPPRTIPSGTIPSRGIASFPVALGAIAAVALALRIVFPAADPPWNPTVGVVWHDEGAWVHNARNRVLFGAWSLDAWNPMYLAPVFTALEYASFALLGVGVRQARLVSELAGFVSVLLLAAGVRRFAGPTAGIIAGALLATNYVYVMYNRAALMEATMVAFMVAAWYCYVRAQDRPLWGAAAAVCALLAFFTKAASAFFVAALGLEATIAILRPHAESSRRAGLATLGGLAGAGAVALAAFVAPNWTEYRFYNWQMSVTRKPSYDLRSLLDRVTWFPILHDLFTRMWLVLVVATGAALGALARWREIAAAERLLILWLGLGALELLVHDVGNERRFVFFIPALIALAAIVLGGERRPVFAGLAQMPRRTAVLALPIVLYAFYVMGGAIVRVLFLYQIRPGVRTAAVLAAIATTALYVTWPRVPAWLARGAWTPRAALLLALLLCTGDLVQFAQWAAGRSYKNYEASLALGRVLPPGTPVHGKLANGLSLENRIRPVFVGRGFGNYEDRKRRDDVRYILTYVEPRVGYEGPVIRDVLDAYPDRRLVLTLEVAETTGGHDRAALFEKSGGGRPGARPHERTGRAHD